MHLLDIKIGRLEVSINWGTGPDYRMKLGNINFTFPQGIIFKMATVLPDDKVLPFVAPTTGVDKKGNATKLKGTVKVTSSDAGLATITQPDPSTPDDPNSGIVVPTGPLGSVQLKFEDDDEGGSPLIALADVEIVGGDTVGLASPSFGPVKDPIA